MTIDQIRATIAAQRKRKRALGVADVDYAVEQASKARTYVRVYGSDGFVANSYKFRAEIQYVQAMRASPSDPWQWSTGWAGAHKPHGRGSLVVVT